MHPLIRTLCVSALLMSQFVQAQIVTTPPTLSFPSNIRILEDQNVIFSTANNTALTIIDAYADITTQGGLSMRIIPSDGGRATLAGFGGITVTREAYQGTRDDLNTALNGMSYLPAIDFNGNATLTFALDNFNPNGNAQATVTIPLIIEPVNDAPRFNLPNANLDVMTDVQTYQQARWVTQVSTGASNESNQTLAFNITVVSDPQSILAGIPEINATTSNLTANFNGNNTGVATLEVVLKDSGGVANGGQDTSAPARFTITRTASTVTPTPVVPNKAPSFVKGADMVNNPSSARVQTVAGWATAINAGDASESAQVLTFDLSIVQDANNILIGAPSINATSGDLTYGLTRNLGTAEIRVILRDNGGTANGGQDRSTAVTFTITQKDFLTNIPALTAEDVANLPPEIFAQLTEAQAAQFTKEALSGLTDAQYAQLATAALNGFTRAKTLDALKSSYLATLSLAQVKTIDPLIFRNLDSKAISYFLTNLNANLIKPDDIKAYLPLDWNIATDGTLTLPPNQATDIALKELPPFKPATNALAGRSLEVAAMVDLQTGFGLGGKGRTALDDLRDSLAAAGFADFILEQKADGVLIATNRRDPTQVFAFLPDAANIRQERSDTGTSSGNLTINPVDQRVVITTENERRFPLNPSPKSTEQLLPLVPTGSSLKVDKKGVVLAVLPVGQTTTTRSTQSVSCQAIVFDAAVEHNSRAAKGISVDAQGKVRITYEDNTSQVIYPTVPNPDTFMQEVKKFGGVSNVVFKVDGTFSVVYQGQTLRLLPSFQTECKTNPAAKAEIVVNPNGTLSYTYGEDDLGIVTLLSIVTP